MKKLTLVALCAGALTLSACGGGATVEDSTAPTTGSTITSLSKDTAGAKTSTTDSTETTDPGKHQNANNRPAPAPRDQGAREVSEAPSAAPVYSDTDRALLERLQKDGVKTDGVEDQILGTANTVCHEEEDYRTTVRAVAGQLIEQNRTDLPLDRAAAVIETAAREAYC
ncbi:DUF732 domain-containing protein [Corynebacterium spheniscorum]|uniref:Uncharacterized protein n=1 Tax=Corynebacterium spheniscorum TaxID=185761 RepID=A0A1I2URI4_9CORY|nr:DUF732 domain-containing protein [Corynebacterium spheniscorum]KAA8719855.1 DUF732 domain-containing protein [Corynebacterium spheniscorum]SFG79668.1 Protein of unknown function [Corynebacterium spheniscorum]